jgi:hypothetical protein
MATDVWYSLETHKAPDSVGSRLCLLRNHFTPRQDLPRFLQGSAAHPRSICDMPNYNITGPQKLPRSLHKPTLTIFFHFDIQCRPRVRSFDIRPAFGLSQRRMPLAI